MVTEALKQAAWLQNAGRLCSVHPRGFNLCRCGAIWSNARSTCNLSEFIFLKDKALWESDVCLVFAKCHKELMMHVGPPPQEVLVQCLVTARRSGGRSLYSMAFEWLLMSPMSRILKRLHRTKDQVWLWKLLMAGFTLVFILQVVALDVVRAPALAGAITAASVAFNAFCVRCVMFWFLLMVVLVCFFSLPEVSDFSARFCKGSPACATLAPSALPLMCTRLRSAVLQAGALLTGLLLGFGSEPSFRSWKINDSIHTS